MYVGDPGGWTWDETSLTSRKFIQQSGGGGVLEPRVTREAKL